MKPVSQIYALILEDLKGFNKPRNYYSNLKISLAKTQPDKKKLNDKIQDLRMKDVQKILFGDVLRVCENRKNKAQEITKWFKPLKIEKDIDILSSCHQESSDIESTDDDDNISDFENMSDFEDIEIEF